MSPSILTLYLHLKRALTKSYVNSLITYYIYIQYISLSNRYSKMSIKATTIVIAIIANRP
jgi:hypothetical protein